MKDKFDTGLLFSNLFISKEIVGRMSSRHSSRRDVGMGSKAQEVGLVLFIIVCRCVIVAG